MNIINEIGDTPKGQEMLGRTAERAYQRAQRTNGADKKRYMRTYNDAYKTGSESSNKHLDGSREHFDNGRDYEYEKWSDEHNGNVTESKNMNKKLIRLTESDLHKIVKESVNRVLNEIGDTPKGQLALGAVAGRANVRGNRNTEIAASNKAWDNSASGKVRGTHYDSGYELGKDMERDKQQKQYIASRLKEDVIKESVKRVLSELDWKTYANAANKANQRKDSRYNKFFGKAADEFNKEYGYSDEDGYVEYDGMNLKAKNNDYPSHRLMRLYDYDPETGEYSNPYNYDDGRAMGLDSFMGDRYPRYKNPSLKKFFDNPEQEKAYKRASDEMDKYKLGKSKYVKGQGWQ